jgi:hypothetical protein
MDLPVMIGTPAPTAHAREPRDWPIQWRSISAARRKALEVLRHTAAHAEQAWRAPAIPLPESRAFAQALADDQVDQLFLETIESEGLLSQFPASLVEILRAHRRMVAASVIRQEYVLGEASARLDESAIEHVVLKGALTRLILYPKPHLRPSADIDLLIAPDSVARVTRILTERGFALSLAPHSDTHEASLSRRGVGMDLHWSLLRPGRMRSDITAEILARRVRRANLWSPDDTHLTMAMLVHPAITDYVTARLSSAIDLDGWLRKADVPWHDVVDLLGRIGLRTAAWAMLRWTHLLLDTPVPETVWRALAPSARRAKYLEAWLARHPAALYWQHPNLVRGAFGLALHDRATDAARALWRLARKHRLSLPRIQT